MRINTRALLTALGLTIACFGLSIACDGGGQTNDRPVTYLSHPSTELPMRSRFPAFVTLHLSPHDHTVIYIVAHEAMNGADIETITRELLGDKHPIREVHLQTAYDLDQLRAWERQFLSAWGFPGTAVGVSERRNRLLIQVHSEEGLASAERALEALEIPRDAVIFEWIEPIRPA